MIPSMEGRRVERSGRAAAAQPSPVRDAAVAKRAFQPAAIPASFVIMPADADSPVMKHDRFVPADQKEATFSSGVSAARGIDVQRHFSEDADDEEDPFRLPFEVFLIGFIVVSFALNAIVHVFAAG